MPSTTEVNRVRTLARYHRLRAAGDCTSCGRIKAAGLFCGYCRDERNRKRRQRKPVTDPEYRARRRKERRAKGLCETCGESSINFARCMICRTKANEARRIARAAALAVLGAKVLAEVEKARMG